MAGYIVRRLIAMPLLLLGVVTHRVPAVPSDQGRSADLDRRRAADEQRGGGRGGRKRWGLDRSLPEQYLIYVGNLLPAISAPRSAPSGRSPDDLRRGCRRRSSWSSRRCWSARVSRHPARRLRGALSRPPASITCARLFALIGSSIPVFWSGLILLFVFSVQLGWLPGPGRLDPRARSAAVRHRHVHDRFAARRGSRARSGRALRTSPAGFRARLDGDRASSRAWCAPACSTCSARSTS